MSCRGPSSRRLIRSGRVTEGVQTRPPIGAFRRTAFRRGGHAASREAPHLPLTTSISAAPSRRGLSTTGGQLPGQKSERAAACKRSAISAILRTGESAGAGRQRPMGGSAIFAAGQSPAPFAGGEVWDWCRPMPSRGSRKRAADLGGGGAGTRTISVLMRRSGGVTLMCLPFGGQATTSRVWCGRSKSQRTALVTTCGGQAATFSANSRSKHRCPV